MNKKNLYLISILIPIMISCSSAMNPMYLYYNRTKSSSSQNTNEVTTPDAVDPDKDPFLKAPYNDPNYGGFNASKFDTWLFKVSFKANKLPMYKFFDDNTRKWAYGAKDWKDNIANSYKANDGENRVYGTPEVGISSMTIYKYDKNNPLYDIKGYLEGRMDRFRFYSIDGKAVISLKQYLIAVDTYSKFVFAFAAITATGSAVGNTYPTDFQAIEYHADKIHFYEYDPIGYVTESGDVVFYKHYEDEFTRNPTGYSPKKHGYTKVAERNSSGQGYSPYKPITADSEANEDDKNKFKREIIKIANKDLFWRDYIGYKNSDKTQIDLDQWLKDGYSGKSLMLYKYNVSSDANTITLNKEHYHNKTKENITYKLQIIISDKIAKYVNTKNNKDIINVTLQSEESNPLSINGNIVYTVDNGPIFVDRMQNATFTKASRYIPPGSTFLPGFSGTAFGGTIYNLTYKFNENGTKYIISFVYKNKKYEYNFKLARFDTNPTYHWTAKYEGLDISGTLGKYTRVVLRNNGQTIRSSMTLHSIGFAESPDSDAGLEMVADLQK